MGRLLEREGLLERDTEQLALGEVLDGDDPMPDLVGHSITYRIAVGPHRGRKVFTLQTLPGNGWEEGAADAPGNMAGFSLHAGVAAKATQRDKLERLCRYICRPPVSEKRLFVIPRGDIGYSLKTLYRDGATHVIFEPLDFIARLAALVPPPRLNLTRFHGVFAPNSPYRASITPAHRGRGGRSAKPEPAQDRTAPEQQAAMRWAQRLKRVFQVDVETRPKCGGTIKVIASIEGPPIIERILRHLASKDLPGLWPQSRAPTAQQATLHTELRKTSFRPRAAQARPGAARAMASKWLGHEGISRPNWLRKGRIWRIRALVGCNGGQTAIWRVSRLWILL